MKINKHLISRSIFLLLSLFSFKGYAAADKSFKIFAIPDRFLPILTKSALYIAERVNIDIIDCEAISESCGKITISPKDAFIQTALTSLYNNDTQIMYPKIKTLLFELGHIDGENQPDKAKDQIKGCIQHISYMQSIIEILPELLPKKTILAYSRLHLMRKLPNQTSQRFVILKWYHPSAIHIESSKVRSLLNLFNEKKDAIASLDAIKQELETIFIYTH